MKLNDALAEKKMDIRLRDKLLGEKKLQKKDVQNYLNALPDDKDNSMDSVIDEEKESESVVE